MAELDHLPMPKSVDWNPGGQTSGVVKFGSDDNLLVMFYNKSVHNPSKSLENHRPFYEDKIFIMIQHPGETHTKIDRPVTDFDKARFRKQWSNFVHDRTQVPEGSPIDLLFPNHPSVADNLKGYGVYTIEQCAALSANAIDNIGRGGQEYVNRAQRYLDSSTKGGSFHKLQREKDELQTQVNVMNNQIKQLKEQLDLVMMRTNDPIRSAQQPPFIANYDAQAARIDANHPTKEAAKKRGRRGSTIEDKITDPILSDNNPDIMAVEGQDAPE